MTPKTSSEKELLEQRLSGVLPIIEICGQDYIVNWEFKRLELEKDRERIIAMDGLPLTADAKNYFCYYNTVTMQTVKIKNDITSLPKDIVMLLIPIETKLDPVGVAFEFGRDPTVLVKTFPIQSELKAKVIPLEQTIFRALAERNRKKKIPQKWFGKMLRRGKGKGI